MVNLAGNDFAGSGFLATPNSAATGIALPKYIASSGAVLSHVNLPINPSGIKLRDGTHRPGVVLPPSDPDSPITDVLPKDGDGNYIWRLPGIGGSADPAIMTGDGMNSPYAYPEGWDPDAGVVDGAKLCGVDSIFGPYEQTRFLGASIVGFNCSIGFGNQSSSLTVNLVEDDCPGHPRTSFCSHKRVGDSAGSPVSTDNLLIFNRALLQKTNDSLPDKFEPPEIGSPVYFRMHEFEFTGILQSWQRLEGANGLPTYSVRVNDPRELLEGVQVILSDEIDDILTKPDNEALWNVWNIYGFLEKGGDPCNPPAPRDQYYDPLVKPKDCFGGALLNEEGIPLYLIQSGLMVFGAGYKTDSTLAESDDSFLDFTKPPYGIRAKDGKYILDVSELPAAESGIRFKGPVSNVLDLVSTICDSAGVDFWVECLPVLREDSNSYSKDGGSGPGQVKVPSLPASTNNNPIGPGRGMLPTIKIRTIDRTESPKLDAIQKFIEKYKGSGLIIDSSRGIENIQDPSNVAVLGGRRRDIYQCESHHVPPDLSGNSSAQISAGNTPYIKSACFVADGDIFDVDLQQAETELKADRLDVYIGAAAEAILHNHNLPHGIQPFWGMDTKGNALIGGLAPNPWHQQQWIEPPSSGGSSGGVEYSSDISTAVDEALVGEKVYTIIPRSDKLASRLRSRATDGASNIFQRRGSPGSGGAVTIADDGEREWSDHNGNFIYFYELTLTEMRAALSGFNAWLSLISTNVEHPVTEAFGLDGDNDLVVRAIALLTEDSLTENFMGDLLAKLKSKFTGIFKAGKDGAPTPTEQEEEDLERRDLEIIHNWVLGFAGKMGKQFLVPLYKDYGFKDFVHPDLEPSAINYNAYCLASKSTKHATVLGDLITRRTSDVDGHCFDASVVRGNAYGHFHAGVCVYEEPQTNIAKPNIRIVDEAIPETWPHRYFLEQPFRPVFDLDGGGQNSHSMNEYLLAVEDSKFDADGSINPNTLSPAPSIIMLPFPLGTSFFSKPNGLIEGFCRVPLVDCNSDTGSERLVNLANLPEEDVFYHPGFLGDGHNASSGVFVRCSYNVNETNADAPDNIVYANKDFLKGPFAVATLPAAIKRDSSNRFDLPLKELLILLTSDINGRKTGLSQESLDQLISSLGIGVDEAALSEEFMIPEAFAVPLESVNHIYGPYVTEPTGIAGKTKIVDKTSELTPWQVGGHKNLIALGSGIARLEQQSAEAIEIGSVRVPGFPSGAAIGFEVDHIGRAVAAQVGERSFTTREVGLRGPCHGTNPNFVPGVSFPYVDTSVSVYELFTGLDFEAGDYPIVNGSLGPQITDISVTANVNAGVTTQYQFRTFTKKTGAQFNKFGLDKLRKDGVKGVEDKIKALKKALDLTVRGIGGSATVGNNGGVFGALGRAFSSLISSVTDPTKNESIFSQSASNVFAGAIKKTRVLTEAAIDTATAGENFQGANSDVYSYSRVDANIESQKDYVSKFFMSLDGLLRPVTMDGDDANHDEGVLPRYYQSKSDSMCLGQGHEAAGDTADSLFPNTLTAYYSSRPHPPIVNKYGSTRKMADLGGKVPLGIYGADYEINIDYLNPFTNPQGFSRSVKHTHSSDDISDLTGHDISILGRGSPQRNALDPQQLRMAEKSLTGAPTDAYSEDYRAMALRGPLLIQGWGYDLNGKPIPNYADYESDNDMEDPKKGIFKKTGLTDAFAPGWLKKSDTWPVAPVDLRFDRDRGVWTTPQPFKFIKAKLLEDIDADDDGEAQILDTFNEGDIYDKKGVKVEEKSKVVSIQEDLGTKRFKGSVVRLYYDTENCHYRIISGSQDGCKPEIAIIWTSGGTPSSGGGATKQPGMKIHNASQDNPNSAEAYLVTTAEGDCAQEQVTTLERTVVDGVDVVTKVKVDLLNLDLNGVELDPDTKITITNTLNQPVSPGRKVIVSKCFEDGCYRVLQAEFCPLVVLTSIYLREDYPCMLSYLYTTESGPTCDTVGPCGLLQASSAGGGIKSCNHEAATSVGIGKSCSAAIPAPPPCNQDGACAILPRVPIPFTSTPQSDRWYIGADTSFCFDMEIAVKYPGYPEFQFDVSERVIYLQSAWSNPMTGIKRQELGYDVNSGDGSQKANTGLDKMSTFNNRREEDGDWCKFGTGPGFDAMPDVVSTYAVESDLAEHIGMTSTKQKINITDFGKDGGFDWQLGHGAETEDSDNCGPDDPACCESYYEHSAKDRGPMRAPGGDDAGVNCILRPGGA